MSAPPRQPFRRQTFVLEIDLDQIMLDLPTDVDVSVGEGERNLEDRNRTNRQHQDRECGSNDDNVAATGDRQSRPPKQPSRRSTVRVALDPEQLQAFEEWRKLYAASDEYGDEMSNSVMDSTIDTTVMSCVDKVALSTSLHILEARQGISSSDADAAVETTDSSPPKQPRRRSTLIVTLGQPQGLYPYDDDDYDDVSYLEGLHDSASGEAHRRSFKLGSASGQDSAYGGSFSEDSVDTSVFVELFCKQVLEAQEQQEQLDRMADPKGRGRGRRRSGLPSPRASLRLRGPVHHLRHLMPELDRIESVGTVLDDDDDDPPPPNNHDHSQSQPSHTTKETAESSTPENSTRRRKAHGNSLLDDDSSAEHGRAIACARKVGHDTHPVAPVRALSNQSAATSITTTSSIRPGGRRRSGGGGPTHRSDTAMAPPSTSMTDHNPVQPARRATLVLPPTPKSEESWGEGEANDLRASAVQGAPALIGLGLGPVGYVMDSFAKGLDASLEKQKALLRETALRESVLTVATEVSWESQDDDDDDEEEYEEVGDGYDDPDDADSIDKHSEPFPEGLADARASSSTPCHPRGTGGAAATQTVNAGC